MRILKLLLMLSFATAKIAYAQTNATKIQTLSSTSLKDKIAGGWAGKMIGVTYGAPTEFHYQQVINNDSIKWTPADIKGSLWQDDLYVQLTFLMAMDKYGIDAPAIKFQEMLAKAGYQLWCANMQARKNYFDGIYPPESGNPKYSYRADDIDFQIEADYIGFMNPGLFQNVIRMSEKIGHIMNYGDGIYGGIFVGALYSAAYFDTDILSVVKKALSTLPQKSDYARIIQDVIKLHEHYPGNWKEAWKELDAKWGDVDISGAGSTFNIDAKLNGAYIVMGLLYGEGDVYKTMDITTRCGQDSDCNPSNAVAVLGVMKGFSALPVEMQKSVKDMGDSTFINTTYSFNSAVNSTYSYAIKLIKKAGGKIAGDKIILPEQKIIPAQFEESFPKTVFEKTMPVFSKNGWTSKGNWQTLKQVKKDGSVGKDLAMYSSTNGDEMEIRFEGTGISIMGNWVKDGGIAEVYLDGKFHRKIDTYYFYSNQEHQKISLWHVFQLSKGYHTVKLVVKGQRNPASAGDNIYISEAVIFKTEAKKSDTFKFSFE